MNISTKVFISLVIFLQLIIILINIKKKKMTVNYASVMIVVLLIMELFVIYPYFIFWLSKVFGFEASSNMIFLISFFGLFYIIFVLTNNLSMLNIKIKNLTQELSILKSEIENKERNKNEK